MNERDATLLDSYFNGLLDAEEAQGVRRRAASEPAFGEEFALREKMESFPRLEQERADFVSTLRSVGPEFFQEQSAKNVPLTLARSNLRRWVALAASLALLAVAIWFFTRSGAPNYEQYAQHSPLSLTVMGETEEAKTAAESAFRQKNYAAALAALTAVLENEPENVKAKLYQGICLLELRRPAEARTVFEALAAGNSALREEAEWYVGLSFLQEKNAEACVSALSKIAPGSARYEQAQEIVKGLE